MFMHACDRVPLLLAGRLLVGKRAEIVFVRNLSARGALVETAAALARGDAVTLETVRTGSVDATVAWRKDERAGLRFTRAIAIDATEQGIEDWAIA